MSCPPWIWMYLNEQFPMVCLGCLGNKYFPRDLINPVGWFSTKPSGTNLRNIHVRNTSGGRAAYLWSGTAHACTN